MNYGEWIVAGVLAAILLFSFSLFRRASRRANVMAKFAMTLLLDEFTYRQQRLRFLKLIETTKTTDQLALYYSAQLDLEDSAERNDQTKIIISRMWQLNQRALQTGQSITDAFETKPDVTEDLRGNRTDPFPNHEQNVVLGRKVVKIAVGIVKFRKRMRKLLGM